MSKIVKYNEDAKQCIMKGIDTVADIVKTTIGPKGRNVLIRNNIDIPVITNDGVTIAKSIQLKDNSEDAGAALIISAANKTNEIAGDGTTTTTILAQEMIRQFYNLKTDGENVVQIQKDMITTSQEISDYLKSIATSVTDNEMVKRVATISSGNEETGTMIADAFEQAGGYGSVIVEDSKTGEDNLVTIEGMRLPNGSMSQYLLTDRINGKSQIYDADILITKDKIDNQTEIIPLLDIFIKTGKKVVIICDDIEFEPLNMILVNKAKGAPLNVSFIKLPGFGPLREQLLEDLSLATGAKIMGRDNNLTLRDFDISFLGQVDEATITMEETILKFKEGFVKTDDRGNLVETVDLKQARNMRAQELQAQLDNHIVPGEEESLRRRISNLVSGISIIQVGGNSEVEIKDKKLRIEDALNSVKAAKEEGIVPGGGYSFLQAYKKFVTESDKLSIGKQIVYNSLLVITKQIAENSGFNGQDVVSQCLNENLGFNAMTNKYEDLLISGVINSVKVDRYGLINAASVASTVVTMGGLIIEENEKDYNVLQLQPGPGAPIL